jgi:putative ABC transport system permease protein
LSIQEGRFFTAHDEAEASDICIIGLKLKEQLFGKEKAIGKYILLGSKGLQVVGVLDQTNDLVLSRNSDLLVTNSFFKKIFPRESRYVWLIRLTLRPTANIELTEAQCRSYFSRHLNFDINDKKSLFICSVARHANEWHNFFKNVATFNWIIGVCFLLTGIVGISNMMLVTIYERIEEIAIRRVLGARTVEIGTMILWEIALVTFIAGIIGFAAGFVLLQLLNNAVVPLIKSYYLSKLTCPSEFIMGGLGFIFLASCLASIVPIIRAVKIKPVQALGGK